jgi:PAS domain S-box-containing protein
LQEIEISDHQRASLWTFRYMVLYLVFVLLTSAATVMVFRRQSVRVRLANLDLSRAREREREAAGQLREKVDELSLLGAVVEGSTFGVTIADARLPDLPLVYANREFYRLTGLEPAQVIGKNCRFLTGPLTDRAASAAVGQALREGRPHTTELLNYRRDGTTFWNRLTLFPVGGEPGRPNFYVGYQIDITSLREAEVERQRMLGEIQQAQKLESLGVLVAGVAHEVNNPLGIALTAASHVVLSAESIQRALSEKRLIQSELEEFLEEERAAFDLILSNLRRAADLVRSFKEVSADQAAQNWREVHMRDYLQTLTTSLGPVLKRARCRLELDVPSDFPLTIETGSLGQLVTNLVVNATVHAFGDPPATPDGKAPEVRVSAYLDGETVVLQVADNGKGVPPDALPRLFEPFFTTRRGSGGTGLGLYIVHRIVTQTLGGTMAVETATPHGAVFTARFPRHRPDVRPAAA